MTASLQIFGSESPGLETAKFDSSEHIEGLGQFLANVILLARILSS